MSDSKYSDDLTDVKTRPKYIEIIVAAAVSAVVVVTVAVILCVVHGNKSKKENLVISKPKTATLSTPKDLDTITLNSGNPTEPEDGEGENTETDKGNTDNGDTENGGSDTGNEDEPKNENENPKPIVKQRPYLLLRDGDIERINEKIQSDPAMKWAYRQFSRQAQKLLSISEPLKYELKGKRLLDVSRAAVKRIFFSSFMYKLKKDVNYLNVAENDLNAVCSFEDWHPSHFLDVAEMTFAVSIGYDWLYDDLKPETRELCKEALYKNGLMPSLNDKLNYFLRVKNNWNMVCNSGMLFGAIAIYDSYPEVAQQIIQRSIVNITTSMPQYAPDGAYPEGYAYWDYGTEYAGMMFAQLDISFGTDFGLSDLPGFKESARYMGYMIGTSNLAYNYYDSGINGLILSIIYWFADKFNDPSLAYMNNYYLTTKYKFGGDRFSPIVFIFGSKISSSDVPEPKEKLWHGKGKNPVILIRTGWNGNNGAYVGMKGGSASNSHAHMDSGNFVFDYNGVRWAYDLGTVDYTKLEKAGVDLWNFKQDSQRWEVFRISPAGHSTITVDNDRFDVTAMSEITEVIQEDNRLGGKIDLTSQYFGKLSKAEREIVLIDEKNLQITDSITCGSADVVVNWTLINQATATKVDDTTVKLTRTDPNIKDSVVERECLMKIQSPSNVEIIITDNTGPNSYDEPNDGTSRVILRTPIAAEESKKFIVTLEPQY